ncbi:FkbM family methyltransferase [Pyrobaculum sp.]|uniref:FkbM family methyltransferase n=1 Tax=Pyrobaculum sp. TaxID=2004705 RepID=UPI003167052E
MKSCCSVSRAFARAFNRTWLWYTIIKSLRGVTLRSAVNLFISALFDILMSLFVNPHNPRVLFDGIYFSKKHGLLYYVRGGTDDIYYLLPNREGPVEEYILRSLKSGDVFVDVGANVGYYTTLAAKLGAKVIAMEPEPRTVILLRLNLCLNDLKAVLLNECAYSVEGFQEMCIPVSGHFGIATLYPGDKRNCRKVRIHCTTLQKVLRDYNKVKLVKIDAEGAELDILLGISNAFDKIEGFVIEISRRPEDVTRILVNKGYRVRPAGFTTYIIAEKRR